MRIDERRPDLLADDAAPLQAGGYGFESRWLHPGRRRSRRRTGDAAARSGPALTRLLGLRAA
jgi:hypothetical protein